MRTHGFAGIAVAAALVAGAQTALASRATIVNCGKITAAGRTFGVAETGLDCKRAKTVVQTLAPRPIPKPPHVQYSGVYLSMRCIGAAKGGMSEIQCVSSDGRHSVIAVSRR